MVPDEATVDAELAQRLNELNNAFYRDNAASFFATRHEPWGGWRRCVDAVDGMLTAGSRISLLDVACGNLRFEKFLRERYPDTVFEFCAVDDCAELVGAQIEDDIDFRDVDIAGGLLCGDGGGHEGGCGAGPFRSCRARFDLAVSFGFMHHVPTSAARRLLLRDLVGSVKTGGSVLVSFWRFADDAGLRAKADASTRHAIDELGLPPLDQGDYLLGWQQTQSSYRYCHSFSGAEIDELLADIPDIRLVDRFDADGRTGRLNTYVVLERVRSRSQPVSRYHTGIAARLSHPSFSRETS